MSGRAGTRRLVDLTSAELRALAGQLVETPADVERWGDLLDVDPAAFEPFADAVLARPDGWLELLHQGNSARYWEVSRGASDAAVDRLAEQVRKGIRAGESFDWSDATCARVNLLIGADTPHAHELLGNLARSHEDVAGYCQEALLAVPRTGPVERRFQPASWELLAYEADEQEDLAPEVLAPQNGVACNRPQEAVLVSPGGWACAAPLLNGFSVDLAIWFGGSPLVASPVACQHWLWTTCEDCDEWGAAYVYRASPEDPRKVEILGLFEDFAVPSRPRSKPLSRRRRPPKDERCEGSPTVLETDTRVRVVPRDPDRSWEDGGRHAGQLGGRPRWVQDPDPPDCPQCGRLMFFVGQARAIRISGATDTDYYGFHCEICALGVQINQCT